MTATELRLPTRPLRATGSAADRVPLHAAGIRGGLQLPVGLAAGGGDAAERPVVEHRDVVSSLPELRDRLLGEPAFDGERRGVRLAREERAREVVRVVVWRVDRLLQVHPVDSVVEERVQRPLILLVAAGGAEDELRVAVPEDERGGERRARSRTRPQRAG